MRDGLKRTPLHDRHVELGARMIDFGGWDMPVFYEGIGDEHRAVRTSAGVFDVSHMGQLALTGPDAGDVLQHSLSNDVRRIAPGQAQYSLLTNEGGGIVDDLIVYRRGDEDYLLVVNAANTGAVHEQLLMDVAGRDLGLADESEATGMLALQGPAAIEVADAIRGDGAAALSGLARFGMTTADLAGVPCVVVRTGYTGEDGVEIMAPADGVATVFDAIVADDRVTPCGLGARDTLRLEVCYPLHGNDITPETNAIEAGLGWACSLETSFRGSDVLRATREAGPKRRLVPFRVTDRAVPRQGFALFADEREVGMVTSGTMSPSLDQGIGLAYVESDAASVGTVLQLDVRGRRREVEVAEKPLYPPERGT
jgi:aminomethyltransferase